MSNDLFVQARSRLILDQPFFGTLCLRLRPVEREDMETGATDGVSLFYNPKWFAKLKPLQRVGFLAHEVMHVVCMHMLRRQERDPQKWNVAGDYVINNVLLENHFILPDGGLVDGQYANMSTEAVYNLLPEPPQGWTAVLDLGGCGGVLDHPDMKNATAESAGAIEASLQVAINQAAEAARRAGKLSGSLQTIVDQVTNPKVDWRSVLARFLRANNKSDFTWARPNRRFIGSGMYLPSLHNPSLETIVIAVDTSGSITNEELQQFTSETSHILHDLNPELIHFLQCDSEVQTHEQYTRESLPLKVSYEGRGGTDFAPVLEYIKEHIPNPAALIYLTDLECDSFGVKPHYPVLWVTTHSEEAKYGEVIKM